MAGLTVSEWGTPRSILQASSELGLPPGDLRATLENASDRIRAALGISDSPIQAAAGQFRLVDVAGIIRLGPGIELEVVPKFLGEEYEDWREDFFSAAMLSRYGHLFPRDALRSGAGAVSEMSDLIGHAMIVLFDRARRSPIRVYQREQWQDFEISGEPIAESVVLPDEDGFAQTGLRLARRNQYNAVILAAMRSVMESVRGLDVRRGLMIRSAALAPQRARMVERDRRRVPARHVAWRDLYDLSLDVLLGFGVRFASQTLQGAEALPGYVLRTADTWEDLLRAAVRIGLPELRVDKAAFPLGVRRYANGGSSQIGTTPDITVFAAKSAMPLDAKYKGSDGGEAAVSAGDLYEALAFLRATGSQRTLLLYPAAKPDPNSVGTARMVQTIEVGADRIVAAAVSIRGLSKPGGFDRLARGLGAFVEKAKGD